MGTDLTFGERLRFTRRTITLMTEGAFDVLVAARALEAAGRHVIHLQIGEPDFATPEHIVQAAIRAMHDGHTRYTPPAGIPELRDAVAASMAARGVRASAENVVISPGAKNIIFYAAVALIDQGDEVLLPDPAYPIFESVMRFAGARPVFYSLQGARDFRVDPGEIADKISPRTRLLVLNTPHNPTGSVIGAGDLAAIAELAQRHDLLVLCDEIYSRHRYDEEVASIASFPGMADRTIVVDGFSKTFAMTGWRLGYGVMPAPIADQMTKVALNSNSCTAAFVQHAGIAALTGPPEPVAGFVRELRCRRDLVVHGLRAIDGITCVEPRGAFYVFPDITGVLERSGLTVPAFADRLLSEHGVACLPGTAFGAGGAGHLRLSYAASRADLRTALDRIRDLVRGRE
ncbi:MAG: pyridoxal phosphate-dependent aminotransferase [Gemmatimonadaceae bacterium]